MYFEFINVGDIMLFWLLINVSYVEFTLFFLFGINILDKIYMTCKISLLADIKKKFVFAVLLFTFLLFIFYCFYNPSALIMR